MVRPSDNSTVNVSSLTAICVAMAPASIDEEVISSLQQLLLVLLDQIADVVYFVPGEPAATLKLNWVEPEPCLTVVAINVNVWRFVAVAGIKKEPIWSHAKYGRHRPMLF
jgi:hypothetical protein